MLVLLYIIYLDLMKTFFCQKKNFSIKKTRVKTPIILKDKFNYSEFIIYYLLMKWDALHFIFINDLRLSSYEILVIPNEKFTKNNVRPNHKY